MAFTNEEDLDEVNRQMRVMNDAAQLRDQLFAEGKSKMTMTTVGVAIGLFFVFRFLLK